MPYFPVDRTIQAESGGNPNAQNSRSSAGGLGQFIDSTWLATLRKHRPDITGSDAELLALKSNPDLSREMTGAYASDNNAYLANKGLPVTPGTQYLSHFAGPGGAVGILSADPTTPVSGILSPQAIQANPFLANMTAADLRAWADRKGGADVPAAPGQVQAAAPATAQAAAVNPNVAPTKVAVDQPAETAAAPAAPEVDVIPSMSPDKVAALAQVPQLQNLLQMQQRQNPFGRLAPFSIRG